MPGAMNQPTPALGVEPCIADVVRRLGRASHTAQGIARAQQSEAHSLRK